MGIQMKMPFFKMKRCKDINVLDVEPQENLSTVRNILKFAIQDVKSKADKIERSYYGGSNRVKMTASWANSIKKVMENTQCSVVTSSGQLDDILKKVSDPAHRFTVDMYDVNKVKEIYRRTMDTVPYKFKPLVKSAEAIAAKTLKYCLSFYDVEEDEAHSLDTGRNYEEQRVELQEKIRDNLAAVTSHVVDFKNGSLKVSSFSSEVTELARKANCMHAPFLLLVPSAVESINSACAALNTWIQTDENYAVFISNDVNELETRKRELEKCAQDRHEKYHHLLFRLKQLQSECDKLSGDLRKLSDRDSELTVEEEYLIGLSNDMLVDIENKEYRRDELIKNSSNIHPEVMYEKYSELCEELRELRHKLPITKRRLNAVRYKLTWIGEKKGEQEIEERKLQVVEKEVEELTEAKLEQEVEYEEVCVLLDRARKIHTLKSSPDVVQKIFHGLPVATNRSRLPGQTDKNDPFERACTVVSQCIDSDWGRFYRALPFHPYRGTRLVDQDIHHVMTAACRKTPQQITMLLLDRWRRYHTRARVEDLQATLRKINRPDILINIDNHLNPPKPPTPREDPIPEFLEEHLIPFWKEIEKYDQLRAAKKLV